MEPAPVAQQMEGLILASAQQPEQPQASEFGSPNVIGNAEEVSAFEAGPQRAAYSISAMVKQKRNRREQFMSAATNATVDIAQAMQQ